MRRLMISARLSSSVKPLIIPIAIDKIMMISMLILKPPNLSFERFK